jgi:hypothetical protein
MHPGAAGGPTKAVKAQSRLLVVRAVFNSYRDAPFWSPAKGLAQTTPSFTSCLPQHRRGLGWPGIRLTAASDKRRGQADAAICCGYSSAGVTVAVPDNPRACLIPR